MLGQHSKISGVTAVPRSRKCQLLHFTEGTRRLTGLILCSNPPKKTVGDVALSTLKRHAKRHNANRFFFFLRFRRIIVFVNGRAPP